MEDTAAPGSFTRLLKRKKGINRLHNLYNSHGMFLILYFEHIFCIFLTSQHTHRGKKRVPREKHDEYNAAQSLEVTITPPHSEHALNNARWEG
jgi:hypothetical protein